MSTHIKKNNESDKIRERIRNLKIYTDERFPLVKNSLFIWIFTLSAYIFPAFVFKKEFLNNEVSFGWSLRDFITLTGVFIIVFCFFFQLRIIDEFKDYEEDLKYRAYRPVQRGIVTLGTLRNIGLLTAAVQIFTAFLIDLKILFPLAAVWIYMLLMTKEFFIREWLKRRIVIYALSHVVIMVLIALVPVQGMIINMERKMAGISEASISFSVFQWRLVCFYLICYLNGIILEIGRKTRREDEEEKGVETYSKIWGKKKAAYILCGLYLMECILTASAVFQLAGGTYFWFVLTFLAILLTASVYFSVKFVSKNLSGKVIENISGAWILASHLFFLVAVFTIG